MKACNNLRGTLACLALTWVAAIAVAGEDARPNLLFIMTDQQRFDAMSCAGNPVLETPNMDRIAREGVFFRNAYTANPVCVPARAVFLTGLSPVNVRVEGNGDEVSEEVPDVPTFDSILVEHGYAAEYYGKWHTPYQFAKCYDNTVKVVGRTKHAPGNIKAYQEWLASKGAPRKEPGEGELFSERNQRPYTPISLDLDHHHHEELGRQEKLDLKATQAWQYGRIDLPPRVSYAAFTADETLEALERFSKRDVPFTLTCSFDPPHPPMIIQEPYFSMYPPDTIPVPDNIDDPMTDSPYRARASEGKQPRYRDPEQIRKMRSIYFGMVKEVDDWIGVILDKLDALGMAANTLVIFTSDHGEMLGDHGMYSKNIFYEASVHVPLLMRFPGRIEPGTVVEAPVSTMDVCPTILDYLDMPAPPADGRSLRPFIEGNPEGRDVIAYSLGNDRPNYMIRSGSLKLMMAQRDSMDSIDALYDLEADPHELRNLLLNPIHPEKDFERARLMKARLVAWLRRHEPHRADGVERRKLF